MNLEFKQAVDDCISLLRTGATLESCLARYPQYATDLRPILQTAQTLQTMAVPQERIESVQAGKQRLFDVYARKAAVSKTAFQPVSESSISRFIQQLLIRLTGKDDLDMKLVTRFAIALLLVVGLMIGGGITASVSASALPGDTLYPLKLSLEDLNLLLANTPQTRQSLELQYQNTRQQEVQSVIQLGRQTGINFIGILSLINPDSWMIGGLSVKLDGWTKIIGAPTIGSIINVAGETKQDGTILAHTLTVQGQTNPMVSTPGVNPTSNPGNEPTFMPTFAPTQRLTEQPTLMPSTMPTRQPSAMPTMMPTTHQPTAMPTMMSPTHQPTAMPTMMSPTHQPTAMPTMMSPTHQPTAMPTMMSPTHQPTAMPTMMSPTHQPTGMPTMMPPMH
jgi:hypothetical protein